MRTLLVTGGAGFIGSNFVHYWLDNHHSDRVVVLDALTYAGRRSNLARFDGDDRFHFVHGHIADAALLDTLFTAERPDCVVHFAAESHVDRSIDGPRAFVATNVQGTCELLEAARRHWPAGDAGHCFLHVSTDEVYGSLGAEGLFSEDTPYQPSSPYSASKAASDHLVRAWGHTYGLPVKITNCSNNYGPWQLPEKLIPLMILNALEERLLPVYGDGRQVRDWLYVVDHCRALERVLDDGRLGRVYNIGGESERSNLEVVRAVCDHLDQWRPRAAGSYRELITFVADRPGHDRRYAIDTTRIRAELGWQPSESLETGLARTVQWYLDNPEWCRSDGGATHQRRQGVIEAMR